jgi:ribonuclease VapC
VHTTA